MIVQSLCHFDVQRQVIFQGHKWQVLVLDWLKCKSEFGKKNSYGILAEKQTRVGNRKYITTVQPKFIVS